MIERAAGAGVPFGWVTADEAYGGNGRLRACLEERGIAYVLAVAYGHVLATAAARRPRPEAAQGRGTAIRKPPADVTTRGNRDKITKCG